MKKILFALVVILCSVQIAGAQGKSAASVKKNVEAAEEAVAKKADNVAAWIKLGNAYLEAYNNPKGKAVTGRLREELIYDLGSEKPSSAEMVNVGGQDYTKEVYSTKNYYWDTYDVLQIIEVTQPIYEDALAKALNAFVKAHELDAGGSKDKDIKKGISEIATSYKADAFQYYLLDNLVKAGICFECAVAAADQAPLCEVDSLSIYNAGFLASSNGDLNKALGYFKRAMEVEYYEDGDTFARLADTYSKLEDVDNAIDVLEQGFVLFPESQTILMGLISLYVNNNRDPDKLFVLLEQAKAKDPGNAALYYVEGNVYNDLGDKEKAIACYDEASKVNPEYEFGFIGAALLYYNEAIACRDAATEEDDDAKYDALVEELYHYFELSAENFEIAYGVTKSDAVKTSLAEYLKSIYYNLRERDDKYMAAYEKYSEIVANQ